MVFSRLPEVRPHQKKADAANLGVVHFEYYPADNGVTLHGSESMGASWTTSPNYFVRIVTAGNLSAAHAQRPSHQPALRFRRRDEARKQRMRPKRARLEFGVELHADEPGVISELDRLGQKAVGRHAGE